MAQTFDTSRVGGGTYELEQDASGNYKLKSVGFAQVNKLNLPDLAASDTTTNTYTLATGVTSISSTSKVYFLQEMEDGKFEVYFGDGVLGKAVADGNIVILDYINTNRDAPNGATSFTLSGTIGGFSSATVTTISNAKKLTERKRYYTCGFGIKNYIDIVNGKTDKIVRAPNYDRFHDNELIEWWRKMATKRFDNLNSDGRLRNDLEVWTKDSKIDIIR